MTVFLKQLFVNKVWGAKGQKTTFVPKNALKNRVKAEFQPKVEKFNRTVICFFEKMCYTEDNLEGRN